MPSRLNTRDPVYEISVATGDANALSSRVTLVLDSDVLAYSAKRSGVKSSTTHGIQNRRLQANATETNASE